MMTHRLPGRPGVHRRPARCMPRQHTSGTRFECSASTTINKLTTVLSCLHLRVATLASWPHGVWLLSAPVQWECEEVTGGCSQSTAGEAGRQLHQATLLGRPHTRVEGMHQVSSGHPRLEVRDASWLSHVPPPGLSLVISQQINSVSAPCPGT